MTPLQPSRPRRALPVVILLAILVAAIGAGVYVFRPRFEADPPQVSLTPDVSALGANSSVEIVVTDKGAGLRSVVAILTTAAGDQTLASEEMREPTAEKRITLAAGKVAGLKEGPATLRIHARDYSFSHFFKGNETVVEKRIDI